jgi:hypothetical protein
MFEARHVIYGPQYVTCILRKVYMCIYWYTTLLKVWIWFGEALVWPDRPPTKCAPLKGSAALELRYQGRNVG